MTKIHRDSIGGYRVKNFVLALLLVPVTLLPIAPVQGNAAAGTPGAWINNIAVPFEHEGAAGTVAVRIYFPKNYRSDGSTRTVIALHGYRGNMYEWGQYGSIEVYAEKYGMAVVCPNMGTTTYEMKFYPQTVNPWAKIPGAVFIGRTLIPFLQKEYHLAAQKSKTALLGLSTGARGAVAVAQNFPERIGAVAGLSGDYDPLTMTTDPVLVSVYGSYKENEERWKTDANLIAGAPKLRGIPVYIYHGGKDTVVHWGQSLMLVIKLKSLQRSDPSYSIDYYEHKHARHEWRFWAGIIPLALEFFDAKLPR